jgi:16S rRNA (cytidine1402-2'-O)-methyltransferase
MVFYESPHKLIRTLNNFSDVFGAERRISVSRELTKIYEETLRGTVLELINHFQEKSPKGEFVIVVDGKGKIK